MGWSRLRSGLLVVLCLQNAVYTMLRRYSVGVLKETYSSSSVLLVGEIIKFAWSAAVTLRDKDNSSAEGTGTRKLMWLVKHSLPMFVPAFIFWAMNLLSYVALERIDASTFTVCAQMKILTTAIFSVVILKRDLHARKWRALLLLVFGVVLVSHGSLHGSLQAKGGAADCQAAVAAAVAAAHGGETAGAFAAGRHGMDTGRVGAGPGEGGVGPQFDMAELVVYMTGVGAVLTEVTMSGFAGVYFEKVLKSRTVQLTVWDRNVQLAMYSIMLYLPLALRAEGGLFHGWTVHSVLLSFLGAWGGILVALSVKHTDSILKTFATSGAIVVCAVASKVFLQAPLDVPIAVGSGCAILSLLNYNDAGDGGGSGGGSSSSGGGGGSSSGGGGGSSGTAGGGSVVAGKAASLAATGDGLPSDLDPMGKKLGSGGVTPERARELDAGDVEAQQRQTRRKPDWQPMNPAPYPGMTRVNSGGGGVQQRK